MHTIRGCKYLK